MEERLKIYSKDNKDLSKEEKNLINNYIDKYNEDEYEQNFSDEIDTMELLHLSSQSQNLLNWYPSFNNEREVLEIGGNLGELTSILCNKSKSVTTIEPNIEKGKAIIQRCANKTNLEVLVGNFDKINLNKKFDIIVMIGIMGRVEEIFGENIKLEKIIGKLEAKLKENGRFIVALDNKFGLRYFVGNPENIFNKKFVSLIGYNNEKNKIETFTKKSIEGQLSLLGYNYKFFYPLPDYRMPNVIFSDEQLPQYTNIDKYYPYYTEKSDILLNEIDLFREILKDNQNQFTFFANSFLVEFTKGNIENSYKYISFNNLRKEKYRLITKITDDYVEKQIVNEKSKNHYNNIKENIIIMNNEDIKTIDYVESETIRSKYINQEFLLENVLTKALEENDKDKFRFVLEKYITTLNNNTFHELDYKKTVFYKYGIECDNNIIKKLHYMKNGLWDMTLNNCFFINGELYFFDQEWKELNVPSEYVLYRSIVYTISLRRFINIQDLIEKLGLTEYVKLFEKLDYKIQRKIRDERIWKYYNKNYYFDIDSTKQEMINLNIRSEAKDKAIDSYLSEINNYQLEINNYQLEIENYQSEIEEIKEKNNRLEIMINNTLKNKIKRSIRKIIGGSNE